MNRGRAARAGTSAAAIALGVALLLGVNWLGSRHWARGDWTKTRIYSLSSTTRKLIGGLSKPVRITVFMDRDARLWTPVSELLARYRALSPKIEVEYLDPKRNPARAEALVREFGIRQSTVVFRSGDRKKYVEEDKLADFDFANAQMGRSAPEIKAFKGEEAFTSAILAVTEAR
ncbi:MAG TPA: Gldg family protein, partial [Thermoanaerobaculia bacterium]